MHNGSLLCQAGVCEWGLSFSFSSALPSGAVLGFIFDRLTFNLQIRGFYEKLWRKTNFLPKLIFDRKEETFSVLNWGRKVPKTIF